MNALAKTVFIVTGQVEPEWEEEYNRWYDEEHLPNLRNVPGYLSAERYVAVDGAPTYMALYEVESVAATRSPEHDRAVNTPWTARVRPHYQAQRAFYQQIFPDNGVVEGVAWANGTARVGGLLVVRADVKPEHEQDYNDWFNQEHLPALGKVPGSIGGRRFKAIEGGPTYMTTSYLTSPDVQASAAWKEAVTTPWTARVVPTMLNRWRTVYRPVS
jgi:antibiotic biosynthesis monooxygenase (ABM) superfamily enzyme